MPSLSTLLWGVFCACSWTWCIGMFLPRLMIERFGWPGFLVFAIPNVIGCAAFGYVVRSRQRSQAMVASHGKAMMWFSIVTIAYHMFFIVYLLGEVMPRFHQNHWLPLGAAGIMLGLGILVSGLCDRDWLVLAVITYAVSVTALVSIGFQPLKLIEWHGRDPQVELWWLALPITFGFLLCPYLDLTFHRALQHAPSHHAFFVFGLAFAVMLALTCTMWFMPGTALLPVALAHLMMQVIFTVGAHGREIRASAALGGNATRWLLLVLTFLAAFLPYALDALQPQQLHGEPTYVRFLGFYGLAFPLYVVLFIQSRQLSVNARTKLRYAAVMLLSLPCFELAFLHHRPWLLVIPAVLIMLAKFWPAQLAFASKAA